MAPILSKSEVPSLYNPAGLMWPDVKSMIDHANLNEVSKELEAQIKKVTDSGLKPTHLDGHMLFYYNNDEIFAKVLELSFKYKIPLRIFKSKKYLLPFYPNSVNQLRRLGYIFMDTEKGFYRYKGELQDSAFIEKQYHQYLMALKPGINEIFTHLAYDSPELAIAIGEKDARRRWVDFAIWTDIRTKELAKKCGIIFIGYRPIQELQEIKWKK